MTTQLQKDIDDHKIYFIRGKMNITDGQAHPIR